MARLRIAYVFPRLEWCGPLKGILATIKHLPPNEFDVHLVTFGPPKHSEILDDLRELRCQYHQLHQRRFLDISLARELARLTQEKSIAILHTTVLRPDWHGALAKRYNPSLILISTLRAEDDKLVRMNRGLARFVLSHALNLFFFRYFDHVVALSYSTHAYARRLRVSPSRISLIRNAVDYDEFLALDRKACRQKLAARLSLPAHARLIGMLATFWPYKDHIGFLRVAAAARSRPDLFFLDVGDGPQLSTFRRRAKRKGLGNLLYPGFISDVGTVHGALDVHLFLSHTEGLPRAVMESMAAGTPVVAWNSPGVGETIVDGETGFLLRPGDVAGAMDAIDRLLADEGLRNKITTSARQAVRDQYSPERLGSEHAELYSRLIRG